jgi:hypothetical protein
MDINAAIEALAETKADFHEDKPVWAGKPSKLFSDTLSSCAFACW